MDPLSALSIATSVLQFLDFATKLLTSSREIFGSSQGATSNNLTLETSCNALKAFSDELSASISSGNGELSRNMQKVADDCKSDCEAILDMLQKLKVDSHKKRRLESLKSALRIAWGARELKELEGRIEKARSLMDIYVQSLARYVMIRSGVSAS